MQSEPERCIQPGAQSQVQHRAQLPLHGAALPVRARAQGSREGERAQVHRHVSHRRALQLLGLDVPQPARPRPQSGLRNRVRPVDRRHPGRMRHARRDPVQILGPSHRPSPRLGSVFTVAINT